MSTLIVQVDTYPPETVLATLSPNLWILLQRPAGIEKEPSLPASLRCPYCDQYLRSWEFPNGASMYACGCVSVVYRVPHTGDEIVSSWRSFRALKRRIDEQLTSPARN